MKALFATAVFCLLFGPAGWAAAAEFRFTPTLGIVEDVTDNAYETPSHRRGELLTVLQPGAGFTYATPSSHLEANYNLDYRYYAKKTSGNEISHTAALTGSFAIVDQFLKLDVSDTYSRISLDIARSNTAESANQNQTDQNTGMVSPYLNWRFSESTQLRTGGRFIDTRYFNGGGIDRRDTGAFAELDHLVAPRLTFTARYVYNDTSSRSSITFSNTSTIHPVGYHDHSASGGFRYQYRERSAIYATGGYNWQHYDDGEKQTNPIWDAGIAHDFGSSIATLETKRRFVQDPLTLSMRQTTYSLRLDKVFHRSTMGLSASYDDYVSRNPLLNRHGVTVVASGTREIGPRLISSLTLTGDRITYPLVVDYPYHVTATTTLRYLVGPLTDLNFTYTYATYRYHLDDPKGSVEINRLTVQLKRSF